MVTQPKALIKAIDQSKLNMKEIIPIVFSDSLKQVKLEQSNIGYSFDKSPFLLIAKAGTSIWDNKDPIEKVLLIPSFPSDQKLI